MIAGVVIGATLLLLVVNLGSLLLKRYGRHVFKSKVYSYVSVVLLNVAQWNSSNGNVQILHGHLLYFQSKETTLAKYP